ncbi:hypothetical protein [Tessaracoccus massiliensis]|uniref:hypothetical protein n=1 Tax=Tessaracoccus massiliensis TaxID=1522311 RepID=UPI00058FDE95|nr:hypothetical protein [Tessaracoccus massiliensis]
MIQQVHVMLCANIFPDEQPAGHATYLTDTDGTTALFWNAAEAAAAATDLGWTTIGADDIDTRLWICPACAAARAGATTDTEAVA